MCHPPGAPTAGRQFWGQEHPVCVAFTSVSLFVEGLTQEPPPRAGGLPAGGGPGFGGCCGHWCLDQEPGRGPTPGWAGPSEISELTSPRCYIFIHKHGKPLPDHTAARGLGRSIPPGPEKQAAPLPCHPQSPKAVLSPQEEQAQTWRGGGQRLLSSSAEGPAGGWPGLGEGRDAGGVGFL